MEKKESVATLSNRARKPVATRDEASSMRSMGTYSPQGAREPERPSMRNSSNLHPNNNNKDAEDLPEGRKWVESKGGGEGEEHRWQAYLNLGGVMQGKRRDLPDGRVMEFYLSIPWRRGRQQRAGRGRLRRRRWRRRHGGRYYHKRT